MKSTILMIAGLSILLVTVPVLGQDAAAEKVTYVDHVMPVLKARCGTCHNNNDRKGSLSIDTFASIMEGGSSGTVIEPGDSGSSYLFMLVNHEDEPKMPPNADKLPEAELALIKKWIDLGALENSGSMANIKKSRHWRRWSSRGRVRRMWPFPMDFWVTHRRSDLREMP